MPIRRILAALCAIPSLAAAQSVCKPPASSNDAKLLAYFAGPLAFGALPELSALGAGQWTLAGELTGVPSPPSSIARSTGECGFSKSEHSGLSPVLPRPRLAYGLGGGWVIDASWLPPVTVAD